MVYLQWSYCSKDFSAKKLAELEFWPIRRWFSPISFKLHSLMIKETVQLKLGVRGLLVQSELSVSDPQWCSDRGYSKPSLSRIIVHDWRWFNSFCLSEHVGTETISWQRQKMKKILNLNYRNLPKNKKESVSFLYALCVIHYELKREIVVKL